MSTNDPTGTTPLDNKKVEIVVSVSLRKNNETHVVGETSVSVDRDTLLQSPVNVKMNFKVREKK